MVATKIALFLFLIPIVCYADEVSDAIADYGEDPSQTDADITYLSVWLPVGMTKKKWTKQNGMKTDVFDKVLELVKKYKEREAVSFGLTVTDEDRANFDVYVERSVPTLEQINELLEEQADRLGLPSSTRRRRRKRAAIPFYRSSRAKAKWPQNGLINYKLDGSQTAADVRLIKEAIKHIERETCLSFVELLAADRMDDQHLLFTTDATGCFSYVGKTSTLNDFPQQINLQPGLCTEWMGVIVHEMCHAAGMWHEQARSDSTEFVEVLVEKIKMEYLTQFARRGRLSSDTYGLPFDPASIMHYPSKEFGKTPGTVTLQTKDPLYQNTTGQRAGLTFYDGKLLNKLYCDEKCPTKLNCANHGYTDPKDCSQCRCPEGFGGKLCEDVALGNGTCVPTSSSKIVLTDAEKVCVNTNEFETGGWYPLRSTCNWHVETYDKCTIDMWFEDEFGVYCIEHEPSCMHWVEIKYKGDLALRGPRFCCYQRPDFNGKGVLTSDTNKAVITFSSEYPLAISSRSYIPKRRERRGFKLCFKTSSEQCYTPPAPKGCGSWEEWSEWSECTRKCGGCGTQSRTRVCNDTNWYRVIQSHFRVCNKVKCPPNTVEIYRPPQRKELTDELIISLGKRLSRCCYDFRFQEVFPEKAEKAEECSLLGAVTEQGS